MSELSLVLKLGGDFIDENGITRHHQCRSRIQIAVGGVAYQHPSFFCRHTGGITHRIIIVTGDPNDLCAEHTKRGLAAGTDAFVKKDDAAHPSL